MGSTASLILYKLNLGESLYFLNMILSLLEEAESNPEGPKSTPEAKKRLPWDPKPTPRCLKSNSRGLKATSRGHNRLSEV